MTNNEEPMSVEALLGSLHGTAIPGGCEHCNADQTFTSDPDSPGITHLTIRHEDWCPELASRGGGCSCRHCRRHPNNPRH